MCAYSATMRRRSGKWLAWTAIPLSGVPGADACRRPDLTNARRVESSNGRAKADRDLLNPESNFRQIALRDGKRQLCLYRCFSSLICGFNSLFAWSGKMSRNASLSMTSTSIFGRSGSASREIACYFPDNREIGREQGSIVTATTTKFSSTSSYIRRPASQYASVGFAGPCQQAIRSQERTEAMTFAMASGPG